MINELEALLFVAGDEGISINDISKIFEITKLEAEELIQKLQKKLKNSSLQVYLKMNIVYLATKPKYETILKKYTKQTLNKRLSKASLEVLAIIAYRQPITRLEIEQIRGVNSSGSIQKLQAYNLVADLGKSDTPGRSRLLGTTNYFLEYFNLKSLAELPKIEVKEEMSSNLLFEQVDNFLLEDEE